MSQAEVAHHANEAPEYACSRPEKHAHLHKKALAINVRKATQGNEEEEWPWDGTEAKDKLGTNPSDVELYERRSFYSFWPYDTPISPHLPPNTTPEQQVAAASLWEFFRLVKFRGGRQPYFEWHEVTNWPIVVMSPVVKLTEGPDFACGVRWALMQCRSWFDRRDFLDMSEVRVKEAFREWRQTDGCLWHVKH